LAIGLLTAVTKWGAIKFRYMGLCWLVRWFLDWGYRLGLQIWSILVIHY